MLILSLKAMTKSQYAKQLQRPEWKAKRLEILERDGNKCVKCGETKRLHVHHLSYTKGRDAWEYPNDNLVTLCGECHRAEHPKSRVKSDLDFFYITFTDSLTELNGKLSIRERETIDILMSWAEYNTNEIMLPPLRRIELSDKLKISIQGTHNIFSSLKKNHIITASKGVVRVNPLYFWKGDSEERIKRLNATH